MTELPTQIEDQLNTWLTIIQGEFQEMPGLHLTKRQVKKLWGLEESMCDVLLERLQNVHFLRMTSDGRYVLEDQVRSTRAHAPRVGLSKTHSCD
jgi:hypothetical protein